MGLVFFVIFGFVVGLIARAIMPGEQKMGLLMTAGLGIAGSFLGGFLTSLVTKNNVMDFNTAGIIGSIVGALVLLFAVGGPLRSPRARLIAMKATNLLKAQHRKVKGIFKKLEKGGKGAADLLHELANDLCAHMAIEQEIFYPAIKHIDEDLVFESFEEHALGEIALKRLLATATRDVSFTARVTATKELIEHHVKEEEEDLFPKCERKLGAAKLEELGIKMKARFDEVVAAGFEASVPKGFARTSSDKTIDKTKNAR